MADNTPPRLVIDPGVLISAIITPVGPSADLLRAIRTDEVVLIASPKLLEELRVVLAREKFRRYLSQDEADEYADGLQLVCELIDDPSAPPAVTRDPNDDYLVAIANAADADALISGDQDLLVLPSPRVLTPRQSLSLFRHR